VRAASQADLPLLRRLISPHVGAAANFVQFEPQGLQVVINAVHGNGCLLQDWVRDGQDLAYGHFAEVRGPIPSVKIGLLSS